MKTITKSEGIKIFAACNSIRAGIIKISLKSSDSDIKSLAEIAGQDSFIHDLILSGKWKDLFENEDWKKILGVIQDLDPDERYLFIEYLKTIFEYFPEEVEGILFEDLFL